MEVLKSDDKLREEILNDAKTKAERIIKKANSEAKELENSIVKEIEKYENESKNLFEKTIEEEKKKIFASIDIDYKKKSFTIIGDIIDNIFNQIKNNIKSNKKLSYKDICLNLILKSCELLDSDEYKFVVDKNETDLLGKDFFKSIKLKKGKITEINEMENISGIIVYNSDNTRQSFISLDKFIEDLKLQERNKIYNILFN